jgi:hypothetical protein
VSENRMDADTIAAAVAFKYTLLSMILKENVRGILHIKNYLEKRTGMLLDGLL